MSPIDIASGSGGQFPLSDTARSWTILWLTLKALGWRSAMKGCLSSLPVRVSFKHGKSSFYGTLMPNPRFYELIMGWPIGWTEPEAPVTGYAAWLQRSRGQFLKLLTTFRTEASDEG